MKHIKLVSRRPQVAQTLLQRKIDFFLFLFDSGVEFGFNKFGSGTL